MLRVRECASRFSVLVPESSQEFTRHLLTALVAVLVQGCHDRAVAGIVPERVVDAAQYGLQFLAVFAVFAGRVVRIVSHAVHVFLPFALSFAKDTCLPHTRSSRPEGIQSRRISKSENTPCSR